MKRESKEVLVFTRNFAHFLVKAVGAYLYIYLSANLIVHNKPWLMLSVAGAGMTTYFLFCWGEGRN